MAAMNLTTPGLPPPGDTSDLVANLDRYLWMFVSPVILLFGFTGNLLIILVLLHRAKITCSTTCVYLPAMAVWDSATLITGIIPEWLEAMQIVTIKELSAPACKIEKFLFYTSADTATWILVLFTVDRFVAVCFPLKKRNFSTKSRAKVAVCVCLVLAITKNLHVFWTRGHAFDLVSNTTSNCGMPEPFAHFELFIRPWIAFSVASALPFLIILMCNVMIIKTLMRVQKMRRVDVCTTAAPDKSLMQTVTMCLSASFTFLVCVTPSMVLLIGRPYWSADDDNDPNYAYNIAKSVNNQLVMVNHSVNVVLYCLSGQKFREELALMIRCSTNNDCPAEVGGRYVQQNIGGKNGGRCPPAPPKGDSLKQQPAGGVQGGEQSLDTCETHLFSGESSPLRRNAND